MRSLRRAVHLDPKSAQARYDLAIALERCNLLAEAVTSLEETLSIDSDYPDAHESLARIRLAAVQSTPTTAAGNGSGGGGASPIRDGLPNRRDMLLEADPPASAAPTPSSAVAAAPSAAPKPAATAAIRPAPVSNGAAPAATSSGAPGGGAAPGAGAAQAALATMRGVLQPGGASPDAPVHHEHGALQTSRFSRVHVLAVLVALACVFLAFRIQSVRKQSKLDEAARLAQANRPRGSGTVTPQGAGRTSPSGTPRPPKATRNPAGDWVAPNDPRALAAEEAQIAETLNLEVRSALAEWEKQGKPTANGSPLDTLREKAEDAIARTVSAARLDPSNPLVRQQRTEAGRLLVRIWLLQDPALATQATKPPPPSKPERADEARAIAVEAKRIVDKVSERLDRWERVERPKPLPPSDVKALAADLREAMRLAEKSIATYEDEPAGWVQKIRALNFLGEKDRARKVLENANEKFPGHPSLREVDNVVSAEG